jgi:hypothetical protein
LVLVVASVYVPVHVCTCGLPDALQEMYTLPLMTARSNKLNTKNSIRTLHNTRRIHSSGLLGLVPLVRIDVLEECIASTIGVTRIGKLGTLAVTSN